MDMNVDMDIRLSGVLKMATKIHLMANIWEESNSRWKEKVNFDSLSDVTR